MARPLALVALAALPVAAGCRDFAGIPVYDLGVPADAAPPGDAGPALAHPAVVSGHVDGDTLDVRVKTRQLRLRLRGVDTPEVADHEDFSEDAAAFTRVSAPQGGMVGLEFDDDRCAQIEPPFYCHDDYNRLLAYVRLLDGRDLGAELVRRGLARVFDAFPFDRIGEYREMERQAQEDALGIWSR